MKLWMVLGALFSILAAGGCAPARMTLYYEAPTIDIVAKAPLAADPHGTEPFDRW
jgi:hypothetical protein